MSEQPILQVQLLDDTATVPHYAHLTDSGLDVHLAADVTLPPWTTIKCPLRFKMSLPVLPPPFQAEIQVRPRSGVSLNSRVRIANAPGTIDAGYQGEVCLLLDNLSHEPIPLKRNAKLAQLVVAPVVRCQVIVVEQMNGTDRGEHGFGSSGP